MKNFKGNFLSEILFFDVIFFFGNFFDKFFLLVNFVFQEKNFMTRFFCDNFFVNFFLYFFEETFFLEFFLEEFLI